MTSPPWLCVVLKWTPTGLRARLIVPTDLIRLWGRINLTIRVLPVRILSVATISLVHKLLWDNIEKVDSLSYNSIPDLLYSVLSIQPDIFFRKLGHHQVKLARTIVLGQIITDRLVNKMQIYHQKYKSAAGVAPFIV